jgi:hypothetical protein
MVLKCTNLGVIARRKLFPNVRVSTGKQETNNNTTKHFSHKAILLLTILESSAMTIFLIIIDQLVLPEPLSMKAQS